MYKVRIAKVGAASGVSVVSFLRSRLAMVVTVAAIVAAATPAGAETLAEALASAYTNNPTINAQRAALRATDEGVPQALSGYRPTIAGSASAAIQHSYSTGLTTYPTTVAISVVQPIFSGFQTKNSVNAAESAVLAGRESLRSTEQSVLLSAVTAFMDLVEAQANLNLQKQNVDFLDQQKSAADDKLKVGEGTRTDVAQTQSSLAAGQSQYDAAVANLNTSIATYEQIIGHRPRALGTAKPVDFMLPKSLDAALAAALASNPSILAAVHNIDVASYNVNVLEGAFLPNVSVTGTLSHSDPGGPGPSSDTASLLGKLTVPIYQAGLPNSKVRQAKETLGQQRILRDAALASVRQQLISAWGTLDAARAQARAANAQVQAQTLVLSGEQEQQKVGQSTTLDVLNAQQTLLTARQAQISAQHDRVVASYSLLSAMGMLNADKLALKVQRYDETDHYRQVRDKWHGLRTPDGR